MKLLLVEDDKDLSEFVQEGMAREGFTVDLANNGQDALDRTTRKAYDVILLDIMMPGLDGYAVLKKLRGKGHQGAILLVTCKGQERDKLEGLNNGADDYIVKPFLLTELVARVKAVLRRTTKAIQNATGGSVFKAGDLSMDLLKREVKQAGKPVRLTKTEFDLLECFMRNPGQVMSQSVLSQHVTGSDFNSATNIIEVHVKNLRAKLGSRGAESLIRTVRGCGYALDV